MKKKIIALALVLCLVAVAVVGGTLAYFTDEANAKNEFTVGNVDIDLTEPNWEETGKAEAEDAYPGEPLAKDPTVTNTGKNPCFVRVSVSNLDQFGNAGMIIYRTDYVDNALSSEWTYYDGYYYYHKDGNGVLPAGETTDALFDQIVIPVGVTNNAETQPIEVIAQAVQAQGARASFSDVQTMTVPEIAEWFGTCGMDAEE